MSSVSGMACWRTQDPCKSVGLNKIEAILAVLHTCSYAYSSVWNRVEDQTYSIPPSWPQTSKR